MRLGGGRARYEKILGPPNVIFLASDGVRAHTFFMSKMGDDGLYYIRATRRVECALACVCVNTRTSGAHVRGGTQSCENAKKAVNKSAARTFASRLQACHDTNTQWPARARACVFSYLVCKEEQRGGSVGVSVGEGACTREEKIRLVPSLSLFVVRCTHCTAAATTHCVSLLLCQTS